MKTRIKKINATLHTLCNKDNSLTPLRKIALLDIFYVDIVSKKFLMITQVMHTIYDALYLLKNCNACLLHGMAITQELLISLSNACLLQDRKHIIMRFCVHNIFLETC